MNMSVTYKEYIQYLVESTHRVIWLIGKSGASYAADPGSNLGELF